MIEEPIAKPQLSTVHPSVEDNGNSLPRSVLDVLTSLNERVATGAIEELVPMATGFLPLDKTLGGGVRPGELTLIGGGQGSGKTTMALQMARNMAASGQSTVLYVCTSTTRSTSSSAWCRWNPPSASFLSARAP